MITIKTTEEIKSLKEGGKRLAQILSELAKETKVGVSTLALDEMARKLCEEQGDKPAFLNYKPEGARRPYPASLCVSINDEIVHGIPNENPRTIKDGDIVGLDMGLVHKGLVTDSAVTVAVGEADKASKKLMEVTKEALYLGIKAAKGGAYVGDIGEAIENFVHPKGYGIAEGLAGHGVGYKLHEDPYIPNYGRKGSGPKLVPGMVIAIEPMLNLGTDKIKLASDGYTYKTADGKNSAHFEHTILITDGEAEILTR